MTAHPVKPQVAGKLRLNAEQIGIPTQPDQGLFDAVQVFVGNSFPHCSTE